jgi:hypothetical protein
MEYAEAKRIRGKSFGTMLGENEGGLGESLKAAISQKTQAKMTGLKEKFDPMNIAKFMTGGSNWAPALLGKLTGRKQSSIDYFSGVKRRGRGTAEKLGAVGSGGGDFLGILQSIESLLHTTREEDKLKSEEENNFAEEKALEKERRHKELIEALTGKPYKEKVVPTAIKEDEPSTLFNGSDLSLLRKILGWFGGPVGLALLGVATMAAFFGLLYLGLQALNKITPNMKALSPEEAENILKNGSARDIESFGGRERLENVIKNGKKEAQEALDMPEGEARDEKLRQLGGEDKVRAIVKDEKVYTAPGIVDTGPEKVPARPTKGGLALKSKQDAWDKNYGDRYNHDGTKKTATPVNNGEGNEQFKKESEEWANKHSNVPSAAVSESPTPVTETPKPSQALNNAQNENLDLNVPVSKPDPSTVAINQSANISKGGKPRGNIPLVRNAEETIQRMIYNNTRVV